MGPRSCGGQDALGANDYGGLVSSGESAHIAYAQKRPGLDRVHEHRHARIEQRDPPPAHRPDLGATAGPLQVQTVVDALRVGMVARRARIQDPSWKRRPGRRFLTRTVGSAVNSWTDAFGMLAGTTYYFKVKAANVVGDSAASNEASATPSAGPPGTPGTLQATGSLGHVSLSWSCTFIRRRQPDHGLQYLSQHVERHGEVAFSHTGGPNTAYVDYDVAGTTYFYKVRRRERHRRRPLSNEAEGIGAQPRARRAA